MNAECGLERRLDIAVAGELRIKGLERLGAGFHQVVYEDASFLHRGSDICGVTDELFSVFLCSQVRSILLEESVPSTVAIIAAMLSRSS
jgi:hypothetical protein